MERQIDCETHGRQGIGLVCTHIAHATDAVRKVGFFWGDADGTARPDAWCAGCEKSLVDKGWSEGWFEAADFKIFCAGCWDFARRVQIG